MRAEKRKARKAHVEREKIVRMHEEGDESEEGEEDEWDMDDLAKEARLVKKLKRGEITEEDFNAEMGSDEEGAMDL